MAPPTSGKKRLLIKIAVMCNDVKSIKLKMQENRPSLGARKGYPDFLRFRMVTE